MNMKQWIIAMNIAVLAHTPAYAINAKYRQQLERSGCTQVSEAQGCDITKTKEQNAKAGFATKPPAGNTADKSQTPYAGQWVAKGAGGATVSTIRVDGKEHVWVNGKRVNAKRSDGALVFHEGTTTFTIQGDRRLKGEDVWVDSRTHTKGQILPE